MTSNPSPPQAAAAAHFDRGVGLENAGDLNGARSAYERVAALDPAHVEALSSLAWLDAQAGDSGAARIWAGRALALDATNVLARMALAFAELQEGALDLGGARLALPHLLVDQERIGSEPLAQPADQVGGAVGLGFVW